MVRRDDLMRRARRSEQVAPTRPGERPFVGRANAIAATCLLQQRVPPLSLKAVHGRLSTSESLAYCLKAVHDKIFPCGNLTRRCRWSAGFLGDLPFPPPLQSGDAPHSYRSTVIGSQDTDANSRPNLFTHYFLPRVLLSYITGPRWFSDQPTRLTLRRTGFDYPRGGRGGRGEGGFPDFRASESRRTMLLVGGGSPVLPALAVRRSSTSPRFTRIGSQDPERLAHSPPTKATRAQSPAGSPNVRKGQSCRTMPLVAGFLGDLPFSPAP
ncbi:hypothetical protein PR048_016393 [Dryococelus australis]|uniref:Uncharacterized protein n=1 Tax=Dryococelus australis TaxID=614101 RepID=A0ABQ9HJK4_9NEOP|nr:hypothetical protein PR048_016393 [Dryococelus australis]